MTKGQISPEKQKISYFWVSTLIFLHFKIQIMTDSAVFKITGKLVNLYNQDTAFLIRKIFQDMLGSFLGKTQLKDESDEFIQKKIKNSWGFTDSEEIKISNSDTRYKLQYGLDFKNFLDARDQVMEHQFDFLCEVNNQTLQWSKDFIESQLYKQIKIKIKKFLSEAIGNVISAGFKFLCKKELGEFEAKEVAAKNTLLNIYSIHKQTIKSILQCKRIIFDPDQKELLKEDLILEVNNIVENILTNLADSFPQAPISGGTPRMKQAISEINMVDDPEKDFIYLNKIPLLDNPKCEDIFKDEEYDYTKFIMKVINHVIEIPQDSTEDYKDRTIFEKFRSFNEHLFSLSENKKIKKHQVEDKKTKQTICSNFNQILSNQEVKKKDHEKSSEFLKCWNKYEDVLIDLRKNKAYALGQKVPIHVEPFNRLEIEQGKFTSKHSSILRTLTKWVGYLEETFKNPEKTIMTRKYPFVSLERQLVELSKKSGRKQLIEQLKNQEIEVSKKFKAIERLSYRFISEFLGEQNIEQDNFVSSVNRFTETRKISSKISVVLTSLMLSYANTLIHHLVKAGKGIETDKGIKNINLITFKVSDLMRSKFCCSESGFINLLKIMQILNEDPSVKKNFNLVRIKNKLNDPANNIMINYLFMGKIQCELQLSIQNPSETFKNYYAFSHFAYQLIRGKFGAIAECAIMISQLDPMIQACKQNFYQEHVKKRKKELSKVSQEQREEQKQLLKKLQVKPFLCSNCRKLVINESNREIEHGKNKCCFSCFKSESEIQLKETFKHNMQDKRKKSFDLKKDRFLQQKYWIILDSSGFKVQVIVEIEQEFEIFSIILDEQMLQNISDIDYTKLNYIKIKKKISSMIQDSLVYQFDKIQEINEKILLLALRYQNETNINQQQLDSKIAQLIKNFKDFRIEKNMIKNILSKTEILQIENPEQLEKLKDICTHLRIQGKPLECQDSSHLKYQKHEKISLKNIKIIKAKNIEMTAIPTWLKKCKNLSVLNLGNNKIKKINTDDLPSSLQFLNLEDNKQLCKINLENIENLEQLRVSKGKLEEFDMKHNKNLKKLIISSCGLTEFDMDDNNSLEELDISQNNLTQLDLKKNKSLKTINLKNNSSPATVKLKENQKLESIHVEEEYEENLTIQIKKPCQNIIPQPLLDFCRNKERLKKAKIKTKRYGGEVEIITIEEALNMTAELLKKFLNTLKYEKQQPTV